LLLEAFEKDVNCLRGFHLKDAVKNLNEFHDHTREPDDPLFLFWKQQNIGGKWVSNAGNLAVAYPVLKAIDKSKDKIKKSFTRTPITETTGLIPPMNPNAHSLILLTSRF
jgi:hypothetical protein